MTIMGVYSVRPNLCLRGRMSFLALLEFDIEPLIDSTHLRRVLLLVQHNHAMTAMLMFHVFDERLCQVSRALQGGTPTFCSRDRTKALTRNIQQTLLTFRRKDNA